MIHKGRQRNNYSKEVYEKYGREKDTVLNVFIMSHHADSLKSPTYKHKAAGIAFRNWLKVSGWHLDATDTIMVDGKKVAPKNAWYASKNLNHEAGHTLGLRHTWRSNDGCDDTPKNPNCWYQSDKPPCDSLWSNNIMDYNAKKDAWTPCQIGRIHQRLSTKSYLKGLLVKTWCTLDTTQNIEIRDSIVWKSPNYINGNIIISEGGSLEVQCDLAVPPQALIIVNPGAKFVLNGGRIYNDCEEQWGGIQKRNFGDKRAIVKIVHGSSLDNVTF